ncbi:MAG: hypothetical protein ACR2PL_06565 [Dehalococcoidia bacterium]
MSHLAFILRTNKHALLDIVTIALCAVIYEADRWLKLDRHPVVDDDSRTVPKPSLDRHDPDFSFSRAYIAWTMHIPVRVTAGSRQG